MIIENLLLPRFLILELVFACHYLQYARASAALCSHNCGAQGVKHLLSNSVHALEEDEEEVVEWIGLIEEVDEEAEVEGGSEACEVAVEKVGWQFPPLMFRESGRPALPVAGRAELVVRVGPGRGLVLGCPGQLQDSRGLRCGPGGRLLANSTGWPVRLAEAGCGADPRGEEAGTGTECGPGGRGRLSQLGFRVSGRLAPLLTVCHREEGEVTHYTSHNLPGHLLTARLPVRRPNFREGDLYYRSVSAAKAYRQSEQRASLEEAGAWDPDLGLFLARGHLVPQADMLYPDWQQLTFFYSNTVPQWQVINNGNWRAVEDAVRERAGRAGGGLEVVTGALGVLELVGRELYLAGDNIPVPKWVWKAVRDPSTGHSIVLLTSNNPQLVRYTRSQAVCPDCCEETGWARALQHRLNHSRGLTVCCEAEQFRQAVPWLPLPPSRNILTF